MRSYPNLFGEGSQEDDFSEETQFATKWGWYSSIYQLTKGDVTRIGDVTKQGLFTCLTMLSFEKQKNEIEIRNLNKIHGNLL